MLKRVALEDKERPLPRRIESESLDSYVTPPVDRGSLGVSSAWHFA